MTSSFMNYTSGSTSSSSTISVNGVKANANGNITIPVGASYLSSLNDCSITTPSNAQQLKYNSTNQKWQNTSPATFTTALSALNDCYVSSIVNNNVLYYNSTNSKWQNKALGESDITNLSSDLSACEKTANKNVASGYCPLDINSLVPVANIPSIAESYITNLTTDLSNCEKSANKNVASGYCPLDSNSLIPAANIPKVM